MPPKIKVDKNKPKTKADKAAQRKKAKEKQAAKLAALGGTAPNSNNDKAKNPKKK